MTEGDVDRGEGDEKPYKRLQRSRLYLVKKGKRKNDTP